MFYKSKQSQVEMLITNIRLPSIKNAWDLFHQQWIKSGKLRFMLTLVRCIKR